VGPLLKVGVWDRLVASGAQPFTGGVSRAPRHLKSSEATPFFTRSCQGLEKGSTPELYLVPAATRARAGWGSTSGIGSQLGVLRGLPVSFHWEGAAVGRCYRWAGWWEGDKRKLV